MSFKATVKSCSSGDTIVLRGAPGPQGQPPKERTVHLGEISAPRLGNSQREDEPWAYESREFLRALVINKQVTVTSSHSLPATDGVSRDIGSVQVNGVDVATEVLRNGWAKVKDIKREPTDEDIQRRAIETDAKNSNKGLWNSEGPPNRTVYHTMPNDSQSFMAEWKGKPIPAVVEQVRDGSTLRVRLVLSDELHQFVTLALAGIRSPRAGGREGEAAEPFGEEAKFFVESRLLQRHVTVNLLSLPAPSAAPFSSTSTTTAPQSATVMIGTVMHPAGNIAEHLVASGYARVMDWHAGMLSASGGMETLRAAERAAKEKKLNLYASSSTPSNAASGAKTVPTGSRAQFEAQVVRVWSGDQISVYEKENGRERRIQLSSVRGPKASDPKQAYWATEAREFLRKKLIGKSVRVHIDFIRPREGEFEERECATVRYGSSQANVAEQLIEKGLATAVRHKRDDENRSPDYDKLIAAEQGAAAESKGLHSGKEQTAPRIGNASESNAKASQFLSSFKRAGRVPAVVDFVAAGSRFKLLLPKENQSLTFVLSGIRAPRAARTGEKGEPYGTESLDFASRRYMQRDVEVEFEAIDKSGGFIGALYLNKTENAAVAIVQEGLASVHDYSAEGLSWVKQLYDAEAEAKKARKNMWKDYDEEAEAAVVETVTDPEVASKPNYQDIIISDVRTSPVFGFSVQFLNNDGIASLEKLMHDFSLHYRGSTSTPGFMPKAGQLVSARFSGDNEWYRAKVRRASPAKKEAELTFIDYGNQETVTFANIRPLDPKFQPLPAQAQDARLSFVKLIDPSSEYHEDSAGRFRDLVEGKKMIANIDSKEGHLLHLRLIDPSDPAVKDDPLACINTELVREGLAIIDRKGCKYISAYSTMASRLSEDSEKAKKSRAGIYEFGDVSPEDD